VRAGLETPAVGPGGVAVPPLPASFALESCAPFESHCGLVPAADCGPLRGGVADRGRRESELDPRLDGIRLQAGLDRRLGNPACNARSMSACTAFTPAFRRWETCDSSLPGWAEVRGGVRVGAVGGVLVAAGQLAAPT